MVEGNVKVLNRSGCSGLPENKLEWRTGRNNIPLVKRTTWSVFCKTGKKFSFGSFLTLAERIGRMTFYTSLRSIVFHLFDWKNHHRTCYCCGASVASEQQHDQDLRRIHKREYEFSNSSLFTRMHCTLPEYIAPLFTRVYCATNNTRMSHWAVVLFRVDSSEKD